MRSPTRRSCLIHSSSSAPLLWSVIASTVNRLPSSRSLRPRPTATCPLRAVPPAPARLLLRMLGIELAARRFVLAHRDLALLHRPVVLLALPFPVTRVLENRDAGEVDGALASGMVAPVLHVEHDAA